MSHITKIELLVTDLDALEEAAGLLGLELRRGQKTHRWYGRLMGDSPLPKGMRPEAAGKCEHALRLKDGGSECYEIGVVRVADGVGFALFVDTWQQRSLMEAVGEAGARLRQEYSVAVALRKAKATLRGFVPKREAMPNGRIRLRMQRR